MSERLLEEDAVMQVCFVTGDLDASVAWFSRLTGKPAPRIGLSAPQAEARTEVTCVSQAVSFRQAIFRLGSLDVEFIEPGPEVSTWREVLERRGPGFHHLAFRTRNMTRRSAFLEGEGHVMVQRGEFGSGRYAYFDAPEIGGLLELLEFNADMEPQ